MPNQQKTQRKVYILSKKAATKQQVQKDVKQCHSHRNSKKVHFRDSNKPGHTIYMAELDAT